MRATGASAGCRCRAAAGRARRPAARAWPRRWPRAARGGRTGAGLAGTTGSTSPSRGRGRGALPLEPLEPHLRDVEVAGREAGLAVGEVELPLAAERLVEAERLHLRPARQEALAPAARRLGVAGAERLDGGHPQRRRGVGGLA